MNSPIQVNGLIGSGPVRIDAHAKVTGAALYGADQPLSASLPAAAHAILRTAPIARGRIASIDDSAARAMPGVLEILTYKNVGKSIKPAKTFLEGGYSSHSVSPLATNKIYFAGQIIALVIAESAEIAESAAEALIFTYKSRKPSATLGSPGTEVVKPKALGEPHLKAGDLKEGFAEAAVTIDAEYHTPANTHNPIELFQTTAAWSADADGTPCLTIWESTQSVRGFQHGLARLLSVKPKQIRIISPFIGGAFGSKGEIGPQTPLIALAAQRLNRPVKLVASRRDGFTLRTFRAETSHHLRLGADAQGHLTALSHESWELTARTGKFALTGSDSTARLYRCPNVWTQVHNVEADRQEPGFMRAPPETPYLFAMESAMDELAHALNLDPIELRRRNDTMVETVTGKPYTSRSLVRCINHGAELFGWSNRNPTPGSMCDGEDLIGYGYATALYPTQVGPADCRLTLLPNLHCIVEVGTHEIGTGIRTVLAQTAGDLLGLPLNHIDVKIGDSSLPAAPLSAGSNTTASVCSALAVTAQALTHKLARRAHFTRSSALYQVPIHTIRLKDQHLTAEVPDEGFRTEPLAVAVQRLGRGRPIVQQSSNNPHGAPPVIGPILVRKGKPIILGGSNMKDRMQFSFGAQFVEVRIDRSTQEVRVSRMVGVFAAGRIMNQRTAWAQLNGGQVWGISSALHEATELDLPSAAYVNQNLAEYHVPVNKDIPLIQTIMLDEVDTLVNPLGIKGVGELGVTGVNAAIANAIFHATGKRIRKLPIRPGDLF